MLSCPPGLRRPKLASWPLPPVPTEGESHETDDKDDVFNIDKRDLEIKEKLGELHHCVIDS